MEGDGHPNPSNPKLSKSGSAGVVPLTSSNEFPSSLRARPVAPSRSMPSPAQLPLAADDKDSTCSNKPRNKGKVVDDSGSSTNNININNGKSTGDVAKSTAQQGEAPREQDRYLPIANVIRLMRKILPTHAKISDDTKESVQECVSEFIGFITSEANERCRLEQRKTITAEDLLYSMAKLGFDDYIGPLTLYLQRYRDAEGSVRSALRGDSLPIKRTASDAGLYMPQHQPPPPPYPFLTPSSSQNPCILHPQALFPGGGGTSFAAVEQGQQPPTTINYLFGDMQPSRTYRTGATALGEGGILLQPPRAYRTAGTAYGEGSAPAPAPAPAAYRDAHMYMDMAGASSSSQSADPSQQAPFHGFDPYSAGNK